MQEKLLTLLKNKKFAVAATVVIVFAVSIYVFFNALSLDDGVHNFDIPEEEVTAVKLANEDPSLPSTGVREKGYHIHINLDTHQLYVYKDAQLVKTYPCSGGKSTTPSPEGSWKVVNKGEWGEGFGGAWMGFNVPWGTLVLEYSLL